jgi:hypothetical protein
MRWGHLKVEVAAKTPNKNPVTNPIIIPVETVWNEWQTAMVI